MFLSVIDAFIVAWVLSACFERRLEGSKVQISFDETDPWKARAIRLFLWLHGVAEAKERPLTESW